MFEIFMLYLSIPDRINFLQLGRYSRSGEQRFRWQFESGFDFFSFKLRDDADFLYLSRKAPTGKRGRSSTYDGKQFAGLEHSQARSGNKLDFHINTVLNFERTIVKFNYELKITNYAKKRTQFVAPSGLSIDAQGTFYIANTWAACI